MKTKTKRAEILSYGEEQKLLKLKTIVTRQTTKEIITTQYCSILDMGGKKLLDYRECYQQDKDLLVYILCYSNFFIKEQVYCDKTLNERKFSYQAYTYNGRAIACASESWLPRNEKLVGKLEKMADEANKNSENEL